MASKPRAPITDAERNEMRARVSNGESFLEVSKIFGCSPRTVEKHCVGLRPVSDIPRTAITNKQIEEIAKLRREKVHIQHISRIVGVSVTSVTRYSPRELKSERSTRGGQAISAIKKQKWDDRVALVRASIPPPKPKPRPDEELPDAVLRMTESFRMRGMAFAQARAEAIRIYAKNKNRREQ